jgi:hypothetical protein
MVIKEIKPGDVVARSSYSGDILFRVEKVVKDKHQQSALLRGMFVRLYASAPLHDLEKKNDNEVVQVKSDFLRKKQSYIRRALKRQSRTRKIPINTGSRSSSDFFELPGKVLHLEGDRMYCDRKRDTEGHINSSSETQKDKMSRKPTMPIYDGICGNNALFHKKKAPGKSGAVNLFFIPKHRP